jgi:hypothetical protein
VILSLHVIFGGTGRRLISNLYRYRSFFDTAKCTSFTHQRRQEFFCDVVRITNVACGKLPDDLVIDAGQDRNVGLVSLR